MLTKIKNSRSEGFTIIEVMIVLAIAALILLIVLLAVPALQRNSRNTAIKNDASAVVGGVSEYQSNNDGASPDTSGSSCSTGSVSLAKSGGVASKPKIQGNTGATCNQSGAQTITPTPGNLTIVFGAKCPDTTSGTSVTTLANTRSVAVIYALETNSSNQAKCVDG